MAFHTKFSWVENHSVFGLIKQKNSLKLMVELDITIKYYEIYYKMKYLVSKKVVLQIILIIVSQESELIHIILYLQKKY